MNVLSKPVSQWKRKSQTSSANMTCRRSGGGEKVVVVMAVVTMLTMAWTVEGKPLPHSDEGECLVKPKLVEEELPLRVPLLGYVTLSDNVTLGFLPDQDWEKNRDAVRFNSTGATHLEVRDGKETLTHMAFPRIIPEGWNTFSVVVNDEGVTLTLVMGPDTLTLFTLPPLRTTVKTLMVEGRVAHCSQMVPSWEVDAGTEATVVLQPPGATSFHDQCVEVISGGSEADPSYVSFFPYTNNSKEIPVLGNTTFKFTRLLNGSYVHYTVSKVANNDGGESDGDEVMKGIVPLSMHFQSLLVRGGSGGDDNIPSTTTLVRLSFSPPQTDLLSSVPSPATSSLGVIIAFIVVPSVIVLCMVLDITRGYGVLATVLSCCREKKTRTKETTTMVNSDDERRPTDSTHRLLPAAQALQEEPRRRSNSD